MGIAQRAHDVMGKLLVDALRLMVGCRCANGCWSCVHASKCPEYNMGTDKKAAIRIIEQILRHKGPSHGDGSISPTPSVCLNNGATDNLEHLPTSMLEKSSKCCLIELFSARRTYASVKLEQTKVDRFQTIRSPTITSYCTQLTGRCSRSFSLHR